MDHHHLDVSTDGPVRIWSLNFGSVNALSPEMLDELEAAFDDVRRNDDVSVVVITSGLDIFSAGADATWMAETVERHGSQHLLTLFKATMDRFRDLCIRLRRSDILTIAAINGHAIAGGLELAAACDLRFCVDRDDVLLGVSEMKLFGVLPSGGGGSQYLAHLLGPSRALDFILHAENIAPRRALEIGLVERLYSADELLAQAIAFGRQIGSRAGRVGINAAKRSVLDASSLPTYEGLDVDHMVHWDSMRRGGFLPGVEAFVKRFASKRASS